jgi:hypothetical protein
MLMGLVCIKVAFGWWPGRQKESQMARHAEIGGADFTVKKCGKRLGQS